MKNLEKESGERLKEIRMLFNEGSKLSAAQFGFLLDESPDKIRNYELGRTQISIGLLYKLYKRGINPIYIITGEGNLFTNSETGKELRQTILKRENQIDDKIIHKVKEYRKAVGDNN